MRASERRNPASSHALTVFEARELRVGTPLLVGVLRDYNIGGGTKNVWERRVDGLVRVVFRGTVPSPQTHLDAGVGSWIVLDQKLRFGEGSMIEVPRRWGRASRYAYEPYALGLTVDISPDHNRPRWNERNCVIRPEHAEEFRGEYPRKVRSL